MTRRQLMGLPLAAPWLARAANQKLNVLFIAVDDLNNRLGCYGDPLVKTPNIDRLAARGVRFDRAYCNYPLCNPSRTSLLSGRRPDTTRILDNMTPPRTHLGEVAFLPEHFRHHGYFTARVGKIAHGRFEDAVRWDVSESSRPGQRYSAPPPVEKDGGAVKLRWHATANDDANEPDGRTARRIVELMDQGGGKPWFLGAGFHKPHLPWIAPKKYFDLYPPERIVLPPTPADDRADIPPIALTRTPSDDQMSALDKKTAIAAYHAATSFMDAQVGVLLDSLDRRQLWDRTIVLLFGDHGWHLDDHGGLWRKMTVFEESARAPLIVVAPGKKPGVSPRLVEFVDLYPTLAGLCGLPLPEGLEGASFAPLLDDPRQPWKKAAFTVVQRREATLGRSLRTERYRYTEWGSENVAELYDHQADAREWRNLAADPQHAATVAEMRRLLRAGWRGALPPSTSRSTGS